MPPTTLCLFSRTYDLSYLKPHLQASAPGLEIVQWPDPRSHQAEVAVGWDAPPGFYDAMPQLKLVHGLGAGVDNILPGPAHPQIEVCRVVDPDLSTGMLEYVLWAVLRHHRQFDTVARNQALRLWERPRQIPARNCRVGVMGLGEIGGHIATGLTRLGYSVRGWARSARQLQGVEVFNGDTALDPFLGGCDVLVCVLPLTASTRGLLNARTFAALPAGATLVHCGRGEHLVEADLLAALASGQLRGAVLDVFAREPLPEDHPFWTTEGIVVTPHMTTMASNETVVAQIAVNLAAWRRGEPLQNRVEVARGY